MLTRVYTKMLERKIEVVPKHIMLVADEGLFNNFNVFIKFLSWCKRFGIQEITVCIPKNYDFSKIESIVAECNLNIRIVQNGAVYELNNESSITLNLVFGYKGKDEIADAVKKIARLVERGELNPEDVDEKLVEKFLAIKSSPDLIIKAGKEVPEFLIWQSIYSELYFIDLDWGSFRYVDFLRCLRDYQRRERRYGR